MKKGCGRVKHSNKKKVVKTAARKPVRRAEKAKSASRASVSRVRATTPARATKASVAHVPVLRPRPKSAHPIPYPLATKHIAPPRPTVLVPARSMPPLGLQKKLTPPPAPSSLPIRGPLVVPEFSDAGVLLAITYSIRDGRRARRLSFYQF